MARGLERHLAALGRRLRVDHARHAERAGPLHRGRRALGPARVGQKRLERQRVEPLAQPAGVEGQRHVAVVHDHALAGIVHQHGREGGPAALEAPHEVGPHAVVVELGEDRVGRRVVPGPGGEPRLRAQPHDRDGGVRAAPAADRDGPLRAIFLGPRGEGVHVEHVVDHRDADAQDARRRGASPSRSVHACVWAHSGLRCVGVAVARAEGSGQAPRPARGIGADACRIGARARGTGGSRVPIPCGAGGERVDRSAPERVREFLRSSVSRRVPRGAVSTPRPREISCPSDTPMRRSLQGHVPNRPRVRCASAGPSDAAADAADP